MGRWVWVDRWVDGCGWMRGWTGGWMDGFMQQRLGHVSERGRQYTEAYSARHQGRPTNNLI